MPNPHGQNAARLPGFLAMTLPEDAATPLGTRAAAFGDAAAATTELRALTTAVRAGNASAYAQFYELYSFRIYKHLLAISRGDELAAREVFQSVALKLTRRMEVFDDERLLWAWLQRVARNAFVDYCRARKREARFVPLEERTGPPSQAEPESRMRACLSRLLDECEPAERELLQAFYMDGTPLGELAEQAGQTYKALESRLARLRQKLRAKLLNSLRHED